MKIDVCMVGVIKPKMIEETFNSVVENFLNEDHDFRVIVNIDPIGEKKYTQKDVVRLIEEYGYDVKSRTPDKPSVVNAVRWVLNQAETDLVIFKEDDIKILQPLHLNSMIEVLEANPKLSSLHTDKWGTDPNHKRTISKDKILRCGFEWKLIDQGFYIAPQWKRAYSFLPNLTKGKFIREGRKYIRPQIKASPTNIMKGKAGDIDGTLFKFLSSWDYGYWTFPNNEKQIEDLGKQWKFKRGWKKPPKGVWQTWVR